MLHKKGGEAVFHLKLKRVVSQRTNDATIEDQIKYIVGRALSGNRGTGWIYKHKRIEPVRDKDGKWHFQYDITFEKTRGQQGIAPQQFEKIKDVIAQTGIGSKFTKFPWFIAGDDGDPIIPLGDSSDDEVKLAPGVKQVSDIDHVKQWKDLIIPEELLLDDNALQSHEAFKNIYGRNPQIRVILSAIKAGVETEGLRRGHCALHGHAGCGKTSVLLAIEQLLGEGSVLFLDATSTTKAGLEKLFFYDLKQCPPIVVMEEIEKCAVDPLTIWLGALDDRGEIRKVNFRGTWIKEIRVVFLCTVNNYQLFRRMMGSDGTQDGALASRCVNHIYFPRPDRTILSKILRRDILQNGGRFEWVEPVLDLATTMGINDPRKVLAFLAGGDRLLNNSYQNDLLKIWEQEASPEQTLTEGDECLLTQSV